jgi:hypothetical protein
MTQSSTNLSRRTVLRGGAVVGGLVWATPIVQAVSMTPAHAASSSAPPRVEGVKLSSGGSGGNGAVSGAGAVSGSALPRTGSDVGPVAAVGAGAVVVGAAAVVAARRMAGPAAPPAPED